MSMKLVAALAIVAASILASPSVEARPRASAPNQTSFCGDRYCPTFETGKARVRSGRTVARQPGASRRLAGRHPSATTRRAFRTARSTAASGPIYSPAYYGPTEGGRVQVASLGGSDDPTYRGSVHATASGLSIPTIRGRRIAWCGWWMGVRKGMNDRALWVARSWARVGQPAAGPCVGCIGVQRHHVYEVVAVVGPGRVLAISGNDGGAVRTRVRSTRGTFAWRTL